MLTDQFKQKLKETRKAYGMARAKAGPAPPLKLNVMAMVCRPSVLMEAAGRCKDSGNASLKSDTAEAIGWYEEGVQIMDKLKAVLLEREWTVARLRARQRTTWGSEPDLGGHRRFRSPRSPPSWPQVASAWPAAPTIREACSIFQLPDSLMMRLENKGFVSADELGCLEEDELEELCADVNLGGKCRFRRMAKAFMR